MAAIASMNYSQPHTPIGSASTSAQGERVLSAGRVNSGNALMSPRLKHVRNNQSISGADDSAVGSIAQHAASTPPTAAALKDLKPPPNSYVDIHQLLHEMDTHQQSLHEKNHGVAFSTNKSPTAKSRETSPNQRRNHSPTNNNNSSNNQYHLRAERDMLHDRCQQLQQQVRSLQLAYKESAMRRVQEEQSFREILRSERDRFDRHMSRLQNKIDDRDTLLLEWAKAVYERNTQDSKNDGKGEFIPEIAQAAPQMKDLRNVFSFLTARTAVCVSAAKQYLTQDDIERANSVSRDESRRKRTRSLKKSKSQKKKKNRSNEKTEVDFQDDNNNNDDDDDDGDINTSPQDPISAFRPPKQVKKSTATSSLRKKVGGAARIRKSSKNDNDTDDNNTVAGSIMDVDDLVQDDHDDLDIGDNHRTFLNDDEDEEGDDNDEANDGNGEQEIDDNEGEGDGTGKRRGSTNQLDARKEDSDRILQELVDALSLEDQLSENELTEKNLKKLSAHNKKKSSSSHKIVKEASKEIEDFLSLTEQEKETDRILNEFLQQNARLRAKESKNSNNINNDNNSSSNKTNISSQKPSNINTSSVEAVSDNAKKLAKENELPVSTSQTARTSVSAATNATFSELNFTPLSTASSQLKPMSVTGKNMEDYMRSMRTNIETEHASMYAGLTGIEDNRDLETQLADILQSVSDITKSIESSDDFVNAPVLSATGVINNASGNRKPVLSSANEIKNKPMYNAVLSEENKLKRAEEEQQAAKLYELLQYATESIEEADAAVGSSHQTHVRFNIDEDQDKANTSKKGNKSVAVKQSPEEELRQLVQQTVKSTAEVTKASAQQGQVASAARELQNVVLRSSIDMSAKANINATSSKSQPSTQNTATNNASTLAQGGQKSSKLQPLTNATSVPNVNTSSSTSNSKKPANTNASSKAQQMVEAYTGVPDAISSNINRTNTKASSSSNNNSNNKNATAATTNPTVNPAPGGGSGSVGGDGKYWWDISVGNSMEDATPGTGATTGLTKFNTTKDTNSDNNSRPSAVIDSDLKGGDSLGDSLKLGGELDN